VKSVNIEQVRRKKQVGKFEKLHAKSFVFELHMVGPYFCYLRPYT